MSTPHPESPEGQRLRVAAFDAELHRQSAEAARMRRPAVEDQILEQVALLRDEQRASFDSLTLLLLRIISSNDPRVVARELLAAVLDPQVLEEADGILADDVSKPYLRKARELLERAKG